MMLDGIVTDIEFVFEGSDSMYLSEVEYLGVNCDPETSRLPDGSRALP